MKKALILTYYFPPSGKASLHLPLGIIKNLPEFGIEPVVVTVQNEGFATKDDAFEKLISPELRVYKTPTWEPFDLYRSFIGKKKGDQLIASETVSKENQNLAHRLSLWVRLNLFIPDARIGWYKYAKEQCLELCRKEHFDYIITFGPPHSTLLIGKAVSKKCNIPHIPVLIDPWVDIAYYQGLKRNALTLFIDRHFEKTTLEAAEHIIFVTEFTKKDFVEKYPSIRNKSHVIYWGYSEDMFESLSSDTRKNEELVIVHAGNIFDFQNPAKLWITLKKMSDEGQKINIRFIGTVSPSISRAIEENGLQGMTNYMGFLPYKEMLEQLSGADFLLVCPSEKRHIPGKLFEYLRIGKPVIAIGDQNEEVAEILQKSQAGRFFTFDESPEEYLLNRKQNNTNKNYIESFERKNLTKKLVAILQRAK